tara:strand:+ start:2158 stop:2670 length:513 start_codon:yes stop_codon:yes gene_type:complete
MIADDIKEATQGELQPDAWYVNQLESALAAVQKRDASAIDTQGVRMGDLVFFGYNPQFAQNYEFWDVQPLAVVMGFYQEGFLGCNLHYINPDYRDVIATSLLNTKGESPVPKNSVHKYLWSNMRTIFKVPKEEDWASISLLPTEQFIDKNGVRFPKYKAFNYRNQKKRKK